MIASFLKDIIMHESIADNLSNLKDWTLRDTLTVYIVPMSVLVLALGVILVNRVSALKRQKAVKEVLRAINTFDYSSTEIRKLLSKAEIFKTAFDVLLSTLVSNMMEYARFIPERVKNTSSKYEGILSSEMVLPDDESDKDEEMKAESDSDSLRSDLSSAASGDSVVALGERKFVYELSVTQPLLAFISWNFVDVAINPTNRGVIQMKYVMFVNIVSATLKKYSGLCDSTGPCNKLITFPKTTDERAAKCLHEIFRKCSKENIDVWITAIKTEVISGNCKSYDSSEFMHFSRDLPKCQKVHLYINSKHPAGVYCVNYTVTGGNENDTLIENIKFPLRYHFYIHLVDRCVMGVDNWEINDMSTMKPEEGVGEEWMYHKNVVDEVKDTVASEKQRAKNGDLNGEIWKAIRKGDFNSDLLEKIEKLDNEVYSDKRKNFLKERVLSKETEVKLF